MVQSEVEFESKFWLAFQDLGLTFCTREDWAWGACEMVPPCPTPSLLCKSRSQTTDLVKSADAASEDLGGAQDSPFLTSSQAMLTLLVYRQTVL